MMLAHSLWAFVALAAEMRSFVGGELLGAKVVYPSAVTSSKGLV